MIRISHTEQVFLAHFLRHVGAFLDLEQVPRRVQLRVGDASAVIDLLLLLEDLLLVREDADVLRLVEGSDVEGLQRHIVGLEVRHLQLRERSVGFPNEAGRDLESND